MTTRRQFMRSAAVGGAALAVGGSRAIASTFDTVVLDNSRVARAPRAIRLLILGGTGFTGPHQVRYAVARGHTVTVFNRGRRQAELPSSVEHLIGDRNGDLKSLEGREWDVVIDNPTMLPNWVRLSGELLQNATKQYIFISTISVYADNSQVGMDENTPRLEYTGEKDPFTLTLQEGGPHYGAIKTLSERETERWFPGRSTIIRPGLIVGPGDDTDRFNYWPIRIDRGGEVLAPGTPADPTQIIDARDLAEWTIRMAENGETGIYNATGPEQPRPIGDMLNGIKSAIGSNATFTWVNQEFLREQQVRGWSEMPVWVPLSDENRAFMQVSVAKALEQGLSYRPFDVTARETLAWCTSRPAERQANLRAGIDPEKEQHVLAAWHARG
ncbi:MAG: NAD-dependent epimerase/dehydratase family protein [Longimicrobiales bacterium]